MRDRRISQPRSLENTIPQLLSMGAMHKGRGNPDELPRRGAYMVSRKGDLQRHPQVDLTREDRYRFPDHLVGVTPLVVIPRHYLEEISVNDLRHGEVHY